MPRLLGYTHSNLILTLTIIYLRALVSKPGWRWH